MLLLSNSGKRELHHLLGGLIVTVLQEEGEEEGVYQVASSGHNLGVRIAWWRAALEAALEAALGVALGRH